MPENREKIVDAGGSSYVVARYDVTLPPNAAVKRDDLVTVTSSPYDSALLNVPFRILDVPLDPWQVARYCTAERFT